MLNGFCNNRPPKLGAALAALPLLTALSLAAPAAAAPAGLAKADAFLTPLLAAPHAAGWSSVVIRLDGGSLSPARAAALRGLGADVTRRLPIIGAAAVRVPNRQLPRLAALPFVTRLSWDGPVRKSDVFTGASSGAATAYAQYRLTGQGINVAVLDSGVWQGADLMTPGAAFVSSPSFVPNQSATTDTCGHGTHVAAIIAGNGAYSSISGCTRTFYGIARQAGIVNVRVLDGRGQGSVSSVISGINWVVANKSRNNIRVMNLSLGHPVGESYKTDPLCQAVEAAYKAGIVVVCAAGNSGRASAVTTPGAANEGWGISYGSINSPGNDPSVITVGATKSVDGIRAHDQIATYSGRGPSRMDLILKPDIIAPGNKVISLGYSNSYLMSTYAATNAIPATDYNPYMSGTAPTYFRMSGTSMAAPVVAGAVALMLQADPTLSPDTVKLRLMASASKWAAPGGATDPCTYGAGYLNIPAALTCSYVAARPALSPALVQNAQGGVSLNTSQILSGSHVIWGTASLTDLHVIWGTSALGAGADTSLSGSHVIWGSSVWGSVNDTHVIWGTGSVDLSSTAIKGE